MFSLASIALLAAIPALAADQFVIKPAAFPELCVAPAGAGNGLGIVLANCTADNVYWNIEGSTIANVNTTDCIDVKDGSKGNGNIAQAWQCYPGNSQQQFNISSTGVTADNATTVAIRWESHDVCLDLKDGKGEVGNAVQLWRCVGHNDNQKWIVYDATNSTAETAVEQEDDAFSVFNAALVVALQAENITAVGENDTEEDAIIFKRHNRRRVTFGSH